MKIERISSIIAWRGIAVLLLVLFSLVMLHGLGMESLWIDEGYTIHYLNRPIGDIISYTSHHDANPPLYYLAVKLWLSLMKTSYPEQVLRFPSLVFGVLALCMTWHATRTHFGDRAALWTLLIAGSSHAVVWHSTDARMYSMVLFWTAAHLHFTLHLARKTGGRFLPALMFTATGVCMLATHAVTSLFLASEVIWLAWVLVADRSSFREIAAVFVPPLAALAVLSLPFAYLYAGFYSGTSAAFWTHRPTPAIFYRMLYFLMMYGTTGIAIRLSALVVIIAVTIFVIRKRKDPAVALLVSVTIVPILLSYSISMLFAPIMVERTLLYITIPLSILGGMTAARDMPLISPARKVIYGSVMVSFTILIICNIHAVIRAYHVPAKSDFRSAAKILSDYSHDRVKVVLPDAMTLLPLEYYLRNLPDGWSGTLIPLPCHPAQIVERGSGLEPPVTDQALRALDTGLDSGDSIFLVLNHDWYTDPGGLTISCLSSRFKKIREWNLRDIRIILYK